MKQIPILETHRLLLCPLREQDIDWYCQMDSSPQVMRYVGRKGKVKTRRQVEDWIQRRLPQKDGLGTWSVFLKKDRTFIGCLLLIQLENSPFIEIGYRLIEKYWGQGFATEGGIKVLEHAFLDLRLKEVVAVAIPENRASRRVMEKLGLRYVENTHYYQVEVALYRLSIETFLTIFES
ncbi:MAG: GNAT family N-acetyltransferase [Bacteroidota bacterium]